nr:hypothetical protein [Tanacetum cinerariifolium]
MVAPGPSNAVARRAVDQLVEFSGETEVPKFMKFFILQQIAKGGRFVNLQRDQSQLARNVLAKHNAMIAEMEAMEDQDELVEFSGETEVPKFMKFFILQQIAKGGRFVNLQRDQSQLARNVLAKHNAMIAEMEAMEDQDEVHLKTSREKMSRDVLTVGSTMRILLLYRGEYSQWRERFMNYLEEETDGEAMIYSIQNGDHSLPVVAQVSLAGTEPNATPTFKDPNNDTAKDLWDALERQMRGSEYGEQDMKAAILYEYETFKATEGEQLLNTYLRYLQQNQGDVNDALGYKKKAVVKVEVQTESKGSDDDDISDLKKITALLAKAFNRKKYYAKPTNNNLRTSSASSSANKKPEYVKSVEKKEDKKVEEKKRDMNSDKSSSSAEEIIVEVAYYTSESESESEFKTSEYYDNSTNYALFVNNDDDQEIFYDAIESASENFNKNHIDSQKDCDESKVDHNDSKAKDHLVNKLIQKFNHKIAKCQKQKMSRDVLTVGSTMRILLLYRGEYSQWRERFMNYLEEETDGEAMVYSIHNGDHSLPVVAQVSLAGTEPNATLTFKDPKFWTVEEKKTRKIDHLARSLLIQGLSNDIYSLIDSNDTAKDLWDALERQMRGSEYGEQDRKAAILYEYETFKATEREQLLNTYLRYLQQNQGDVNDALGYKKKAVVVTSDPLALVAEKTKVSKRKEKVEVQTESEGSDDDDISDLKKITALLAKAFNRKKYYAKPTNNNLRTSSASSSANKKPEYVKSVEKKEDKKVEEKKREMSKVKCYNCKKEGPFAKDCKKAQVKDYNYYKTKMLLAKKDSNEQVLLAEDQAWMDSNSDESSSSAEETIAEVAYYTSEPESESEFKTLEYYDNSSNYALFVNNDDDQEIFHDAIESASENFNKNHIDSQKDCDESEVGHNDSEAKDHLVNKLIQKFNHKIAKCQKHLDTFSSVRRPKQSSVIWKKKGSSNTSHVDLSSVSHLKLNKDVKRYSRKDLLSCNNSHLGETSSAFDCNDAMNISCNSRLYASFDKNDLFIFDDESVRHFQVSKMSFRKKPRDSINVRSKSNSNKSLPRTVHRWLPKMQQLAEPVAKWIPKVKHCPDLSLDHRFGMFKAYDG